jgi:hypothetical protein
MALPHVPAALRLISKDGAVMRCCDYFMKMELSRVDAVLRLFSEGGAAMSSCCAASIL